MRFPEILALEVEAATSSYDEKDAMLYALALGFGVGNPHELSFVYEKALRVVPMMHVLLAGGAGQIIERGGLDYRQIVHGEQRLTIHRPLPPSATVRSHSRCIGVEDKGAGKGAVVDIETVVQDDADGAPYSSQVLSLFCRGDGGQGGTVRGASALPDQPKRPPDRQVFEPTMPQQAALYRLTGDRNPLHIDPEIARGVGFERPILHGLCSNGIACRAVLREYCGYDVTRIASLGVRFSAPLFPGETLLLRFWENGSRLAFEGISAERNVPVLSNGCFELHE
jgi:acyl dehydratase